MFFAHVISSFLKQCLVKGDSNFLSHRYIVWLVQLKIAHVSLKSALLTMHYLPFQGLSVENVVQTPEKRPSSSVRVLDGKDLNDIPAVYVVPTMQPYEFAAVGVWIDKRIVPGFRYRVRAIDSEVSSADFAHIAFSVLGSSCIGAEKVIQDYFFIATSLQRGT